DQAEHVRVEHLLHRIDIERPDLGAITVAGVVDENIDAAHLLLARLDGPRVVVRTRDVGVYAVRARFLCHLVDPLLMATGEHHRMPGLPGKRDDGCADTLAASGDEKTAGLHER